MSAVSIDDYTNKFLWQNQIHKLPRPLQKFLGGNTPKKVPVQWVWLEILIATFGGIAVIEAVFKSHTVFKEHNAPLIIASYGASAILCFNASASPLAQPRNVVMGQFVSSLIGIVVQKLFLLSQGGVENYWAGGALSVALLSVAMSMLNCVHPPGGASALLPCADEQIRDMSWWYLPAQLVSSVLMVCVACIFGNIIRSYPTFWWSAGAMGKSRTDDMADEIPFNVLPTQESLNTDISFVEGLEKIEIDVCGIRAPEGLALDQLEREWLESLQLILKKSLEG